MVDAERCPVCGAKAYIHKMSPNGNCMGWSIGCPRAFCIDRVHGENNIRKHQAVNLCIHGFATRTGAVKAWNRRCKHVKKTEVSAV